MPDDFFIRYEFDFANNGAASILVVYYGTLESYNNHPSLISFLSSFPAGLSGSKQGSFTGSATQHSSMNDVLFGSLNNPEYLLNRHIVKNENTRLKATSLMFENGLSDAGITALLNQSLARGTWVQVDVYGGKIARPDLPSAFTHRAPDLYDIQMYSNWDDPAEDEVRVRAIQEWRLAVAPLVNRLESYQNYIDRDVPIVDYYGEQGLERLRALKRRMDPRGFFSFYQGV